MPRELRFCRNCGFRLGEGPAEYTETVRFQNGQRGTAAANRATTSRSSIAFANPNLENVGRAVHLADINGRLQRFFA